MAKKNRVARTAEQKKELNLKIAEIVWYSLGGVIAIGGIVFSILGLIVRNVFLFDQTNSNHPLRVAESEFFSWLGFGSSYANAGLVLILVAILYFAIVFFVFANVADVKQKREKHRKENKKSLKLVIEEDPVVTTTAE